MELLDVCPSRGYFSKVGILAAHIIADGKMMDRWWILLSPEQFIQTFHHLNLKDLDWVLSPVDCLQPKG